MGAIVSQLLLVFVIGCGVVAHPPFCGALMDSHAPTGEEGTPKKTVWLCGCRAFHGWHSACTRSIGIVSPHRPHSRVHEPLKGCAAPDGPIMQFPPDPRRW